jgi:hypothetical protein
VDGRLFPKELNIPVFHAIKNTLWREDIPYWPQGTKPGDPVQTHEKSVYQSVFKWLFMATSDLGVKLAIPVR